MKNFVKALGFTAVLAVIAVIIACSGSGAGGGGAIKSDPVIKNENNDPVVIAGYYKVGSNQVACYWENGKRFDLGGSGRSVLPDSLESIFNTDIFITGTDIYIACIGFTSNDGQIALYYKNGELINLHPETALNSITNAITVVGTDVYVAGAYYSGESVQYDGRACYWKNGELIDLSDIDNGRSDTTDIIVVGTDVYISGMYNDKACYWKNGEKIYLSEGFFANSIIVDGVDVYVAGVATVNDNIYGFGRIPRACYWKNGEIFYLNLDDSYLSWNEAISINNGDLYIAGRYYYYHDSLASEYAGDFSYYWKNGEIFYLQPYAYIHDMVIVGKNVYVVGHYFDNGEIACYWKDGVRTDLHKNSGSRANAIAARL